MSKKLTLFVALALVLAGVSVAQQPQRRVGSEYRAPRIDFKPGFMSQLKMPQGFQIALYAENLGSARMMAVTTDGTVYLTRPRDGDVLILRDTDKNWKADAPVTFASDLKGVQGITLRDGYLYYSQPTRIWRSKLKADGTGEKPEIHIDGLPDKPSHTNRPLVFGPDGKLYVGVGSSCNACEEVNPENATVLQVDVPSRTRRVFARGLRNTVGIAFHPVTRQLWGTDQDADWRGDDQPPEELNLIEEGRHYGWPHCYGKGQVDTLYEKEPPSGTRAEFCAKTRPAVVNLQPHGSMLGAIFYTGTQFPKEYQGDFFIAQHGSWNRSQPVGFKVVRVDFENNRPVGDREIDFVADWLTPDRKEHWGRPVGVAQLPDGSLLISEDSNGMIYRVSYRK